VNITRYWRTLVLAAISFVAVPANAATLTGAINYVSGSDGSAANEEWWNTITTDSSFNLYLSDTTTPTSSADILNPNGTDLDYSLGLGIHELVFIGSNGPFIDSRPFFTLNLFFDGQTTPGISAVWDATTHTFIGAATSGNTRREDGAAGVASGGLSYTDASGNVVTLIALSMLHQPGVNIVAGYFETPDGLTDQFTRFALQVTPPSPVPLPAAALFMGAGLVGLAGTRRAKRNAV